ncbi:MAG: hypothetical protein ACREFQ_19100 [Stellaceae bacterium]
MQSDFLTLPKGDGFIEYPVFELGYQALKRATSGFRRLGTADVLEAVYQQPIAFIVIRTMLGFTPPEWAYITSQRSGVPVSQHAVRSIDRRIRVAPLTPLKSNGGLTDRRLRALVGTACDLLQEGAPEEPPAVIHRLDKADTKNGLAGIQALGDIGVPYAMLLYERFLGRPFAGHRDSVSELVATFWRRLSKRYSPRPASASGRRSAPRA